MFWKRFRNPQALAACDGLMEWHSYRGLGVECSNNGVCSESGDLIAFGVARKKILGQGEYIGLAFAERRESNRKSVETIEQVGTKAPPPAPSSRRKNKAAAPAPCSVSAELCLATRGCG